MFYCFSIVKFNLKNKNYLLGIIYNIDVIVIYFELFTLGNWKNQ